ncbi:MAG TPA: 2,3-bisphosphoglycerate-independent phosphoglycerate mutase [Patescibacteria group bacterium]|nr:2,3-bisphosphoglycerate-independent phosphoglycerate mutase [Patescibacteria group bacterium]
MTSKPVALIILDGWGVAPPTVGNAVTSARLKYWDYLLKNYPSTLLQASGEAVGLPWGKMGNSEVGHLTLGAGQIFLQSLEKINREISTGSFFENQAFLKAVNHVKNNNSNLHLIGLLGDGGVHAHQGHLLALLDLVSKNNLHTKTYLHLFLDGRDTARDSGLEFLRETIETVNKINCAQIASLGGRYYGMDRNKNWDRIEKAYRTITGESEETIDNPIETLKESYRRGVFDEEFEPIAIGREGKPVVKMADNDAIIFFNFRADRARQLTQAFVADDFSGFVRNKKYNNLLFVGFSEYEKGLAMEVAFPRPEIEYPLARIISEAGMTQLHVAETEKYAHVTFFFNGLKEEPFSGEERILVPSPNVTSYDQQPEMSSSAIKDKILEGVRSEKFDFMVVNFASPDMVGHTGNLDASKLAVEAVDKCLAEITEEIVWRGGQVIITADHGNVEEIINLETKQLDKEHSNFPVPVILVKQEYLGKFPQRENNDLYNLKIRGALVDVAPTILAMLGIPKPETMIGIDLNRLFNS